MEVTIIVYLKKLIKNVVVYIILITLIIYKNAIIRIFNSKEPVNCEIEKAVLSNEVNELKNDIYSVMNLSNLKTYNYIPSKIIFRSSYKDNKIHLLNGNNKGINEGYAIVNENGLVGIIEKVYDDYSIGTLLPGSSNVTIKINNSYGTLKFDNNLFYVDDISNYDDINLNDSVYLSGYGVVKEKLYVGKVVNIDKTTISKIIYIKSDVDFSNLKYLYVVGSND